MAFDSYRYMDPLEVVIREEAQTCKGCAFEEFVRAFGRGFMTCKRERKHGTRCRQYREKQFDEIKT